MIIGLHRCIISSKAVAAAAAVARNETRKMDDTDHKHQCVASDISPCTGFLLSAIFFCFSSLP